MTSAVTPPAAPTVPIYPPLGSPTFNQDAYAYGSAMPGVSVALGALAQNVATNTDASHSNALASQAAAVAAGQSEAAAALSVAAAAAAAGAVKWVSGTAYGEGVVVWSPQSGYNYRRKAAGAGAIDPSADATNWWLLGAPLAAPIQRITTNTQAQVGVHYVIEAPLTLTLPPAPASRDVVQITDLSASSAAVVDPGASLIRGASGALVLDARTSRFSLIFAGPEKGWI